MIQHHQLLYQSRALSPGRIQPWWGSIAQGRRTSRIKLEQILFHWLANRGNARLLCRATSAEFGLHVRLAVPLRLCFLRHLWVKVCQLGYGQPWPCGRCRRQEQVVSYGYSFHLEPLTRYRRGHDLTTCGTLKPVRSDMS